MKILHLYKDYHPIFGGIEGNIQAIAETQAKNGHKVTVLVTNPSDLSSEEWLNGVHILRANRIATVASTPLSFDLALKLRQQRPDIVHLHFPYPVGEVANLLMGRGRASVITYHSDIVKQQAILRAYAPILRRVLAKADRIMPTSPNYIQSSSWLKPLAANCTPVPLGINPQRFLDVKPLDLGVTTPKLLFVGRHRYYKGVDTLIHAMRDINATLFIGGDGPMRSHWETTASELALTDKIRFLGNVPHRDLPALFAACDIFVLPANSRAEAFGIVLMEAMASAKPCVTTELSTGTSFIVQDGVTGSVVPPQNPELLAESINYLLHSPDLMAQFGEAGRHRLLNEFSIEMMVDRIQAVYESVLSTK